MANLQRIGCHRVQCSRVTAIPAVSDPAIICLSATQINAQLVSELEGRYAILLQVPQSQLQQQEASPLFLGSFH
jgi:hypothetical protein